MCKILVIAGLSAQHQAAAQKFILAAKPSMSKFDKDGFGYAATSIHDGSLFGERWMNPSKALIERSPFTQKERELLDILGPAVDVEQNYNSFGDITQPFSAIMVHTRMATCGVNLENTHPFVRDDTALIHNGVISNPHIFHRTSSCDSEAILDSYLYQGVDKKSDSIQDMANSLEGYYACGVMARDREERRIVDIFKSDAANLFVAWVGKLNAWVYCTSGDIIKEAADKLRWKTSKPQKINPGWLIRLDAMTGECLGKNRFSPRPRASVHSIRPYSNYSFLNDAGKEEAEKGGDDMKSWLLGDAGISLDDMPEDECPECGGEMLPNGLCSDEVCPISDSIKSKSAV